MQINRLNIVLLLIILSNIINMIFPKGMGFEEQVGWVYDITKYTYGITCLLMLPSVFTTKYYYFSKMQWMAFLIIFYMSIGHSMGFIFNTYYEMRTNPHVDKNILYAYVLSIFINVIYLTLIQNRFLTAVENEGEATGGQSLANSLVFLLPSIALLFKGRIRVVLIIIGFLAVLASLRRTAILGYLLCLPFLYRYMKISIQRKYVYIMLVCVALITYYVYTHYWFIIEARFADMTEANEEGEYGSGRTGWWAVLIQNFIFSPLHYLQGFGLGSVAHDMAVAGYPYSHAHNGYIEIAYTFGFIGFCLWFGTFFDLFKLSKSKGLFHYKSLILMCVISYLFVSMVSGTTFQPHFMCIGFFTALMLRKKIKIISTSPKKNAKRRNCLFVYNTPPQFTPIAGAVFEQHSATRGH